METAPRTVERTRSRTETVHTVVVGAGQAGLVTSHLLTERGIEHVVLDRRTTLGGAWQDRWDSFHLITPNFVVQLPGRPYAGADPEGFLPRDEVIRLFRDYARQIVAPVRLGAEVRAVLPHDGGFTVSTPGTDYAARCVVLATGSHPVPRTPPVAEGLDPDVVQAHTHRYRSPDTLPDGGVLVVGTGQSGAQIAAELLEDGRNVHVAVSSCPSAPRRYRGHDLFWWFSQLLQHGSDVGMGLPTVDRLPTPAARFLCNPNLIGVGPREVGPRGLAQRGAVLHGRVQEVSGTRVGFSDDVAQRVEFGEADFDVRFRPLFDGFADAMGLDVEPERRAAPPTDPVPAGEASLDLAANGITSVVWATGYRLGFEWLRLPILDQWGYPRHQRGVTAQPGLYVVGLPWLTSQLSSTIPGVSLDAAHVVEHLAAHAGSTTSSVAV